jgi:hypothetical protein
MKKERESDGPFAPPSGTENRLRTANLEVSLNGRGFADAIDVSV